MAVKMYPINEEMARRAHEMMSMSDYKAGSKTASYEKQVKAAEMLAESCKAVTDPMYHEKIDRLLDTYARKLADNLNEESRIGCMCPSILISGGSNFPVRKKERQNSAMDRNMAEYREICGLLDKMKSVGKGGIRSDEENAVEKLEARIADLKELQEKMKRVNAYYRKNKSLEGCKDLTERERYSIESGWASGWYAGKPFPPYELTNNLANIKRLEARLEEMRRLSTQASELSGWKFEGGEVVINTEVNRVQILFDEKPDAEMREKLKREAFRWAPSQGAWQRQYTENALRAARRVTEKLGTFKTISEDTVQ